MLTPATMAVSSGQLSMHRTFGRGPRARKNEAVSTTKPPWSNCKKFCSRAWKAYCLSSSVCRTPWVPHETIDSLKTRPRTNTPTSGTGERRRNDSRAFHRFPDHLKEQAPLGVHSRASRGEIPKGIRRRTQICSDNAGRESYRMAADRNDRDDKSERWETVVCDRRNGAASFPQHIPESLHIICARQSTRKTHNPQKLTPLFDAAPPHLAAAVVLVVKIELQRATSLISCKSH